MKKIVTVLIFVSSLASFAQGPVIKGTYLPVRGTSIKEVWDTHNFITPPDSGINMTWDYSTEFASLTDTFQIKTFHPDSTSMRFHQYFPTATHASFLRSPINNLSDSLYSYYIIDTGGLHMLGGFNIRAQTPNNVGYDTTAIINPSELMIPSSAGYGMVRYDTSKYVTYGKYTSPPFTNLPIIIKGKKYKKMIGYSYGTLKMPNGSIYNNVLLARQNVTTDDSVFVPGNPTAITRQLSSFIDFSFLRNNTFGSSYLMYLNANSTNTTVNYGWYTLPVDFGTISGIVYDSINEHNPVHNGEALLYRENSNFARNDILDRDSLDINGHYHFDSIPFGEYRIAIRTDSAHYPRALTTYHGDSTNWISAPTIHTNSALTSVSPIHLQYDTMPNGTGSVQGIVNYDGHIRAIDPIPGVDIIVKKNPGGSIEVKTDTSQNNKGVFNFRHLINGNYTMFVDIPGLHMAGSCNFNISNGTSITAFNCIVGTDSIHPTYGTTLNVNALSKNDNLMSVYPNPYSSSTTVKINVPEKSDVLLEVYNLLGEKIQTIEKAEKGPGVYSYNLNSKNIKYATGTYILKLNVGDKTSVQKIIQQ